MTEVRHDPLRGRRILIAEHRAGRPNEFRTRGGEGELPVECPFCPGNEKETPPELAVDRPEGSLPNDPNWTLRIVPNRYPALLCSAPPVGASLPFRVTPAEGAHEVVLECREHDGRIESLPRSQVVRYLVHLRDRARVHRERSDIVQVLVFRNAGASSGASLSHPHTQLLALTDFASDFAVESARIDAHFVATRRCLVCDLLAAEVQDGRRVVLNRDGFVSCIPFAARYGAELWIAPLPHSPDFADATMASLESLASVLQDVIARMARTFSDPSYNLILNAWSAPTKSGVGAHWRIEIIPRLANVGGFELASGDYIVSRTPEDAAARMRG